MAERDEIVHQVGPQVERLGGAVRSALRRTRGFSPEQEAAFVGTGQTLRARLLDQWWRLLAPFLEEGTLLALEQGARGGPASLVADIQNHETGSGGADRDESVPLDRVREMGVVRGTAYGSQRLAALRHGPREIALQIQKEAFVRQYLPEEEEEEWLRTAPLKKLVRMLQALTRSPPEVARRDPGMVWKDFVACFAPETLRYQYVVGKDLFLGDPQALVDLLLATTRTMQESAEPAQAAGQPLGYVLAFARKATEIKPYRAGDSVPVLVYHRVGDRAQGELIGIQPGEGSALRSKVEQALGNRDSWRDLDAFDEALIAVNVMLPEQPGEGMFSQESVAPGFGAGREAHPWLVYHNGRDTRGDLHLQAAADHFACDGALLALLIRGGAAGGHSFEGLAGFYRKETGRDLLAREPRASSDLEIHDYGQVVLAEMPRPGVSAGGDLFTCAALWAIGLYVNHMQEVRGGIWRMLNPNTACNFAVTERENALRPLSVASCWLGSPEKYSADSPFYPYRHALGLTAGLIGFKLGKELARKKKRLPEAGYWMSLLVHNRFPDWFKKAILELNRSPALTDIRNHLFPPTVIYERGDGGLVHNTVAGTDLPNVAIRDDLEEGQVTLAFSIAPDSHFIRPGELGLLVQWIAPAMQAFLQAIARWQQDDAGTLQDLNRSIEALYQDKRRELAQRYPKGGGRRRKAG
jgi:hypothetical protein